MIALHDAEHNSGVTLPLMSRARRNISMRNLYSSRGWTLITRMSDGHRVRVQFESLLELLTIQMTATLPNLVDLIEQPFEVTFFNSTGKPGRHRIDLLVKLSDGRKLAVAIKPAAKVTVQFRETLAAVKRHLPRELADDLILMTDQDFTRAQAQNALRYVEFTKHTDIEADDATMASVPVSLPSAEVGHHHEAMTSKRTMAPVRAENRLDQPMQSNGRLTEMRHGHDPVENETPCDRRRV